MASAAASSPLHLIDDATDDGGASGNVLGRQAGLLARHPFLPGDVAAPLAVAEIFAGPRVPVFVGNLAGPVCIRPCGPLGRLLRLLALI